MISVFQKLMKPIFGEFEKEEFKKFLRMGVIFAFMIASYWALRPLKNGIFCTFVGPEQLPWAKTASLLIFFPLIMVYTKLLDAFKREKVFYLLSYIYGGLALIFASYLFFATGKAVTGDATSASAFSYWFTLIVNYAFYIWVESYGSLLIALFWAISTDITSPDSAKKGFSFVVALGQFGGIIGPVLIAGLPNMLGYETNALSIVIVACTIFISMLLLKDFFKKTPSHLLTSYHGSNEAAEEKEQEPGFLEGFWLLISHKYLLGIFAVIAFPEIIMTIVDMHFNTLASQHYTGTELTRYLGYYGSSVNFFALLFLLLGAGKITNIFGLGMSLLLMPFIYGLAMLGFISLNSLNFLFVLMACSKAVNYALNGPAIKQLYIPTTHDVRFKSQAWIETFGSRGSKEAGSIFNMLLGPLRKQLGVIAGTARHAMYASYLSFALIFAWFFIAIFLGKKHRHAIAEKKVVC